MKVRRKLARAVPGARVSPLEQFHLTNHSPGQKNYGDYLHVNSYCVLFVPLFTSRMIISSHYFKLQGNYFHVWAVSYFNVEAFNFQCRSRYFRINSLIPLARDPTSHFAMISWSLCDQHIPNIEHLADVVYSTLVCRSGGHGYNFTSGRNWG